MGIEGKDALQNFKEMELMGFSDSLFVEGDMEGVNLQPERLGNSDAIEHGQWEER